MKGIKLYTSTIITAHTLPVRVLSVQPSIFGIAYSNMACHAYVLSTKFIHIGTKNSTDMKAAMDFRILESMYATG